MIWPPPALSVNGLFTETDRIMVWVLACGESDGGRTALVSDLVSNKESEH